MPRTRRLLLATFTLLVPVVRLAAARMVVLAPPRGEVLLRVRGSIAVTNVGDEAQFDRSALYALGITELRTVTPWSDGQQTFAGVSGARLLDAVGASGSMLRAGALNDVGIDIPVADFRTYPVLLALEREGRPLSLREGGPIWIVYPWSQHPELDDRVHRQRSVWQLSMLELT